MQRADERNTWTSSRSTARARTAADTDADLAAVAEAKAERELEERRGLYNGFGNAWQRSIEIALVPPIFGLLGWWLDHRLDWTPVLTILFVAYSVIGLGVRAWFTYDAAMRAESDRLPK